MIDIKGSRINKIDLWVYRPDYTYLGITTHTVECPICKNRQTYNTLFLSTAAFSIHCSLFYPLQPPGEATIR